MFLCINEVVSQEYDSDGLDEPEAPATKKKKITANKAKGKKTGKKDDEDDYEDDDDPYTALSKFGARARPANGSIERCAECEKEFSVVRHFHLTCTTLTNFTMNQEPIHNSSHRVRFLVSPMRKKIG